MNDTTDRPQRLQPRSTSPMADGAAQPAPRKPGRPPKQSAPAPRAPKAAQQPASLPAQERAPISAPTENQLDAMRPLDEQRHEPAGNEPVREHRSARVPFGNQEAKLAVPEREGFTRRWFNDEPGRIPRALRAGYTHVMDDHTSRPLEMVVTRGADKAGGVKAYCLEIPNEFYDEDFARKQEALDIVDMQIYNGTHNEEPGDNRYVLRDQMKMRTKHGQGSHLP